MKYDCWDYGRILCNLIFSNPLREGSTHMCCNPKFEIARLKTYMVFGVTLYKLAMRVRKLLKMEVRIWGVMRKAW